MVDYRRGLESQRKSPFWHWHTDCQFYPWKAFALRTDKPSNDELCERCANLSK